MNQRRFGRESKSKPVESIQRSDRNNNFTPFVSIPNSIQITNTILLPPTIVHAIDSAIPTNMTAVAEDAIGFYEENDAFSSSVFLFGAYFSPIGQDTYLCKKEISIQKSGTNQTTQEIPAIRVPHDPDLYSLVNGRQWVQGIEGRIYRGKLDALSVVTRQDHTIRCSISDDGMPQPLSTEQQSTLLKPTPWTSSGRAIESLMRFSGFTVGRWAYQEGVPIPYINLLTNQYSTVPTSKESAYTDVSCPIQRLSDRIVSHQIWNHFRVNNYDSLIDEQKMQIACRYLPKPGSRGLYKTSTIPLIAENPELYLARDKRETLAKRIIRLA